MWAALWGFATGIFGVIAGFFKTDKPKKETYIHVKRNEELLGDNDPGTPA